MTAAFQIDPFFEHLLGSHPDAAGLERMIRQDGRVTDPVIVWDEQNVLIDGHTRKGIHDKLLAEGFVAGDGLQLPPLAVFRRSFDTREQAIEYVFNRCDTMRPMTAALRAFHYLEAHKDDLAARKAQAKKHQADGRCQGGENGGGDASGACAKTAVPPGDQPNGVAIDVRAESAKAAGVNVKDMAAATKLLRKLSDPEITPKEKSNLAELRKEWERGMVGYRTVETELKKLDDKRRKADARTAVLHQALPPVDDSDMLDRIVACDNLDGLAALRPDSVALFFTSPPYPIENYEYAGHNGFDGDYRKMLDGFKARFSEAYRAQKTGGKFIVQIDAVWGRHGPSGRSVSLPIYADIVRIMQEVGYELLDEICWYKQKTPGKQGRIRWGTYASPQSPKVRRSHEYLLVFFKGTPVLDGDDRDITITPQEFQNFTISHWYVPPETRQFRAESDDTKHPCPFPETLAYRCIQLYTRRGDLVVDPWNGTGTTTYVAHVLGRRYVGFDIAPQFVGIAEKRIAEVQKLTPEQRVAGLRLFKPETDERSDGYGKRKHENGRSCYARRPRYFARATTKKQEQQS